MHVPLTEESNAILGPLIAHNKEFVLAGQSINKVCLPMSMLELEYISIIQKSIFDPYLNLALVFFDTTLLHSATLEGNTVFHLLAANPKFLERMLENIEQNPEEKMARNLVISILHKNNSGNNSFDLVVQQKQARSLQIMLRMLNLKPKSQFAKMIDPHIEALFQMNPSELLEYLENCVFSNKLMEGIEKAEWSWDKDEVIFESSSSYLDKSWLTQLGKVSFNLQGEDALEGVEEGQSRENTEGEVEDLPSKLKSVVQKLGDNFRKKTVSRLREKIEKAEKIEDADIYGIDTMDQTAFEQFTKIKIQKMKQ